MILVNTQGSWSYIYAPLRHAQWHGITATDVIFPFFLFIIGASISFALKWHIQQTHIPWQKLITRSLILFVLGLLLNWFPFDTGLDNIRVMGVLQRIALCYLLASLLIIMLPQTYLAIVSLFILLAYWWLLYSGSYDLSPANNIVAHWDKVMLGEKHLWQGTSPLFEPEGLLSTIPATVTVISGYFAGYLFQQQHPLEKTIRRLFCMALICCLSGYLWSQVLPLNKQLWTSSFVMLTSGMAYLTLALLLYLEQKRRFIMGIQILQIYGSNPLLIYILSWLWAVCLGKLVFISIENQQVSAYDASFQLLAHILPPNLASLTFACLNLLLFYFLSKFLFNKGWFVRL